MIVFVVQMSGGVQYYIWFVFLPTYAHLAGGLDRSLGFAGVMVATGVYCAAIPLLAYTSDLIGRKPFLIGAALCFFLFSYPLLSMLTGSLTFTEFLLVAIVGSIFMAMNDAVIGPVFAELFPTEIRTSGIGIPFAICTAIFGGTAPMIATWLHGLGGAGYISAYVMAICAISLVVHVFVTPETRQRPLDEVPASTTSTRGMRQPDERSALD
jgi:MHS family alpha-ketoglutarate permease-like MFS transporter